VRAEDLPEPSMGAFTEEVKVDLSEEQVSHEVGG